MIKAEYLGIEASRYEELEVYVFIKKYYLCEKM
jgi:hypothetical protein